MGNIPETRIYGKNVDIDSNAVKNLYSARSEKNGDRPVDAPTVLSVCKIHRQGWPEADCSYWHEKGWDMKKRPWKKQ